jgi:hypothetical protein
MLWSWARHLWQKHVWSANISPHRSRAWHGPGWLRIARCLHTECVFAGRVYLSHAECAPLCLQVHACSPSRRSPQSPPPQAQMGITQTHTYRHSERFEKHRLWFVSFQTGSDYKWFSQIVWAFSLSRPNSNIGGQGADECLWEIEPLMRENPWKSSTMPKQRDWICKRGGFAESIAVLIQHFYCAENICYVNDFIHSLALNRLKPTQDDPQSLNGIYLANNEFCGWM